MATSTQEWIDELKSISVLELSERIKALEEEFGVSATAVAAAAPAGAVAADGDGAAAVEEQTAFAAALAFAAAASTAFAAELTGEGENVEIVANVDLGGGAEEIELFGNYA